MVAGMAIVYLFLWVMIVVVKYSSRLERRFAYILPDDEPKAKRKVGVPVVSQTSVAAALAPASGTEVKAPCQVRFFGFLLRMGNRFMRATKFS